MGKDIGLMFSLLLDFNPDNLIDRLCNLTDDDLLKILRRILKNLGREQEFRKTAIKELRIHEYLVIKLIQGKTIIYIEGRPFIQCKYLLMNILEAKIRRYDEFRSIDEAAIYLDSSLERIAPPNYRVLPEEEFWGHCSNIQAWAENNYDTRLLHSNIAFPLLKKLTEAGDPIAKKVFKEEIVERFLEGFPSVVIGLTNQNYLSFLNEEELDTLLESTEDVFIRSQIAVHLARYKNIIKALDIYYKAKYENNVSNEVLKPFAEVWNLASYCFLDHRDHLNAVRAKEEVLKLDSNFRSGWENLGHLYRHTGNFEKAIMAYNTALKKDQRNNTALSHLALVYDTLGETNKAKEYAEQALRIDPREPVAKKIIERWNRKNS